MTKSHADQHDEDKLSRWNRDLSAGSSGRFPVYALFLVSSEHRYAHDVFREFRSSFQNRGAGFEHLMIFGQHGLSGTVKGFLAGFDLGLNNLPLLALFREPTASEVYIQFLPSVSDQGWREVLVRMESAVDSPEPAVDLDSLWGVATYPLQHGSMGSLIGRVLGQASENT